MLTVRVATLEDAPYMQQIYAPLVENSTITFDFIPPSPGSVGMRIAGIEFQFPWLVCLYHAQLAGFAFASPMFSRDAYQWSAMVSVYVDPRFFRRGVASKLYSVLEHCLRTQGYITLYACITATNYPSCVMHEKNGYECLGRWPAAGFKHKSWHDIFWYQKRLVTPPEMPTFPKPFSDFTPEQKKALMQGKHILPDDSPETEESLNAAANPTPEQPSQEARPTKAAAPQAATQAQAEAGAAPKQNAEQTLPQAMQKAAQAALAAKKKPTAGTTAAHATGSAATAKGKSAARQCRSGAAGPTAGPAAEGASSTTTAHRHAAQGRPLSAALPNNPHAARAFYAYALFCRPLPTHRTGEFTRHPHQCVTRYHGYCLV